MAGDPRALVVRIRPLELHRHRRPVNEPGDLSHFIEGESQTITVREAIIDQTWALPGTGDCAAERRRAVRCQHSGGAYTVMRDASERFLSEAIDAGTLQALGTPSANEPEGGS